MELIIKGTPEEIKKTLQAISDSKERNNGFSIINHVNQESRKK
jgi:hypothetical protein